jgi:hypothetical protein
MVRDSNPVQVFNCNLRVLGKVKATTHVYQILRQDHSITPQVNHNLVAPEYSRNLPKDSTAPIPTITTIIDTRALKTILNSASAGTAITGHLIPIVTAMIDQQPVPTYLLTNSSCPNQQSDRTLTVDATSTAHVQIIGRPTFLTRLLH